jgi:DNA repair exonuclease SbcCD ATPase subunit
VRRLQPDTVKPDYWRNLWDRVGDKPLRYLRRPARIAENHVSTVVLARGFELPEALPATNTELEQLNQRLLVAEQARNTLQAQLQTRNQQLSNAKQEYAQLKVDYENLLNTGGQSPGTGLAAQIEARGIRDKSTLSAARKYLDQLSNQPKLQELTAKVLSGLDSVYDRAFWPSMMQLLEAGNAENLLQKLLEQLQANKPAHDVMIDLGPNAGLKDDSVQLWKRTAEFLGA